MKGLCPCGGACLCHARAARDQDPADLTALVAEDAPLTPTGHALVACLAPGRVLRRYEDIWQALRPGNVPPPIPLRHALSVHAYLANRALAPSGLRIVVTPAIGLELVTCEPREPAPVRPWPHPWRASPLRKPDQREAFVALLRGGVTLTDAYKRVGLSESTVRRARADWPEFGAQVQRVLVERDQKRRKRSVIAPCAVPPNPQGAAGETPASGSAPAEKRASLVIAAPASQTHYRPTLASSPTGRPCGMVGCDQMRRGHVVCASCGQRAGAGHAVVDLEAGGLCRWCAEQQHESERIAAGRPRPVQWPEPAYA